MTDKDYKQLERDKKDDNHINHEEYQAHKKLMEEDEEYFYESLGIMDIIEDIQDLAKNAKLRGFDISYKDVIKYLEGI